MGRIGWLIELGMGKITLVGYGLRESEFVGNEQNGLV